MLNQFVEGAKLIQPFACRFRAYLGYARNVVDTVTHQCQKIDHAFRRDTEFVHDTGGVVGDAFHTVHKQHFVSHQLSQVLVSAGNERLDPYLGCRHSQRSDDVISFNSLDTDQRQS